MSAPNPVPNNPAFYKLYAQTKQYNAGIPGGADIGSGAHETVLDSLAFPSAAGIAASKITVAEEAQDNIDHPQAGISGPNDPTPYY